MASILDKEFAAYYSDFMPGLKIVLQNYKWEDEKDQTIRSNSIETIGYILNSVKDKPELCKEDAIWVC